MLGDTPTKHINIMLGETPTKHINIMLGGPQPNTLTLC